MPHLPFPIVDVAVSDASSRAGFCQRMIPPGAVNGGASMRDVAPLGYARERAIRIASVRIRNCVAAGCWLDASRASNDDGVQLSLYSLPPKAASPARVSHESFATGSNDL